MSQSFVRSSTSIPANTSVTEKRTVITTSGGLSSGFGSSGLDDDDSTIYYRSSISPRQANITRTSLPTSPSRTTRTVEFSSGYTSGHIPMGTSNISATGVISFKSNREKEKKDMQDLNERFANYIEKVRFLEAQNKKLASELEQLRSHWGKETSNVKLMYETELAEARKLIDDTNKEKARLQLRVGQLEEQLDDVMRQLDEAKKWRSQDRETINKLNQQVSELEGEIRMLRRTNDSLDTERQRDKATINRLQDELDKLRIDLSNETIARLDAENKYQTLLEEMEFLKSVHEQELKELSALAYRDTTAENREFWKHELSQAIRDIQQEYDMKCDQIRGEMETFYNLKVQEFRTGATKQNMEVTHAREETKKLHKQLGDFRTRNADLEARNAQLEKQYQDMVREMDQKEHEHVLEINSLKEEMNKLRAEMEGMLVELQTLMDAKLSLELEIAAYRKLLECEETRIPLRNSFRHSYTPFSTSTVKTDTNGAPYGAPASSSKYSYISSRGKDLTDSTSTSKVKVMDTADSKPKSAPEPIKVAPEPIKVAPEPIKVAPQPVKVEVETKSTVSVSELSVQKRDQEESKHDEKGDEIVKAPQAGKQLGKTVSEKEIKEERVVEDINEAAEKEEVEEDQGESQWQKDIEEEILMKHEEKDIQEAPSSPEKETACEEIKSGRMESMYVSEGAEVITEEKSSPLKSDHFTDVMPVSGKGEAKIDKTSSGIEERLQATQAEVEKSEPPSKPPVEIVEESISRDHFEKAESAVVKGESLIIEDKSVVTEAAVASQEKGEDFETVVSDTQETSHPYKEREILVDKEIISIEQSYVEDSTKAHKTPHTPSPSPTGESVEVFEEMLVARAVKKVSEVPPAETASEENTHVTEEEIASSEEAVSEDQIPASSIHVQEETHFKEEEIIPSEDVVSEDQTITSIHDQEKPCVTEEEIASSEEAVSEDQIPASSIHVQEETHFKEEEIIPSEEAVSEDQKTASSLHVEGETHVTEEIIPSEETESEDQKTASSIHGQEETHVPEEEIVPSEAVDEDEKTTSSIHGQEETHVQEEVIVPSEEAVSEDEKTTSSVHGQGETRVPEEVIVPSEEAVSEDEKTTSSTHGQEETNVPEEVIVPSKEAVIEDEKTASSICDKGETHVTDKDIIPSEDPLSEGQKTESTIHDEGQTHVTEEEIVPSEKVASDQKTASPMHSQEETHITEKEIFPSEEPKHEDHKTASPINDQEEAHVTEEQIGPSEKTVSKDYKTISIHDQEKTQVTEEKIIPSEKAVSEDKETASSIHDEGETHVTEKEIFPSEDAIIEDQKTGSSIHDEGETHITEKEIVPSEEAESEDQKTASSIHDEGETHVTEEEILPMHEIKSEGQEATSSMKEKEAALEESIVKQSFEESPKSLSKEHIESSLEGDSQMTDLSQLSKDEVVEKVAALEKSDYSVESHASDESEMTDGEAQAMSTLVEEAYLLSSSDEILKNFSRSIVEEVIIKEEAKHTKETPSESDTGTAHEENLDQEDEMETFVTETFVVSKDGRIHDEAVSYSYSKLEPHEEKPHVATDKPLAEEVAQRQTEVAPVQSDSGQVSEFVDTVLGEKDEMVADSRGVNIESVSAAADAEVTESKKLEPSDKIPASDDDKEEVGVDILSKNLEDASAKVKEEELYNDKEENIVKEGSVFYDKEGGVLIPEEEKVEDKFEAYGAEDRDKVSVMLEEKDIASEVKDVRIITEQGKVTVIEEVNVSALPQTTGREEVICEGDVHVDTIIMFSTTEVDKDVEAVTKNEMEAGDEMQQSDTEKRGAVYKASDSKVVEEIQSDRRDEADKVAERVEEDAVAVLAADEAVQTVTGKKDDIGELLMIGKDDKLDDKDSVDKKSVIKEDDGKVGDRQEEVSFIQNGLSSELVIGDSETDVSTEQIVGGLEKSLSKEQVIEESEESLSTEQVVVGLAKKLSTDQIVGDLKESLSEDQASEKSKGSLSTEHVVIGLAKKLSTKQLVGDLEEVVSKEQVAGEPEESLPAKEVVVKLKRHLSAEQVTGESEEILLTEKVTGESEEGLLTEKVTGESEEGLLTEKVTGESKESLLTEKVTSESEEGLLTEVTGESEESLLIEVTGESEESQLSKNEPTVTTALGLAYSDNTMFGTVSEAYSKQEKVRTTTVSHTTTIQHEETFVTRVVSSTQEAKSAVSSLEMSELESKLYSVRDTAFVTEDGDVQEISESGPPLKTSEKRTEVFVDTGSIDKNGPGEHEESKSLSQTFSASEIKDDHVDAYQGNIDVLSHKDVVATEAEKVLMHKEDEIKVSPVQSPPSVEDVIISKTFTLSESSAKFLSEPDFVEDKVEFVDKTVGIQGQETGELEDIDGRSAEEQKDPIDSSKLQKEVLDVALAKTITVLQEDQAEIETECDVQIASISGQKDTECELPGSDAKAEATEDSKLTTCVEISVEEHHDEKPYDFKETTEVKDVDDEIEEESLLVNGVKEDLMEASSPEVSTFDQARADISIATPLPEDEKGIQDDTDDDVLNDVEMANGGDEGGVVREVLLEADEGSSTDTNTILLQDMTGGTEVHTVVKEVGEPAQRPLEDDGELDQGDFSSTSRELLPPYEETHTAETIVGSTVVVSHIIEGSSESEIQVVDGLHSAFDIVITREQSTGYKTTLVTAKHEDTFQKQLGDAQKDEFVDSNVVGSFESEGPEVLGNDDENATESLRFTSSGTVQNGDDLDMENVEDDYTASSFQSRSEVVSESTDVSESHKVTSSEQAKETNTMEVVRVDLNGVTTSGNTAVVSSEAPSGSEQT